MQQVLCYVGKEGINMNIFVLGNGFDLSHFLPTKYENFLHTVLFLQKNYNDSMRTVADVLGNPELCQNDNFILQCFKKHKEKYKKMQINSDDIKQLLGMADKNIWFSYFEKSFNKDLGWIDFEREISVVIKTFINFFENSTKDFFITSSKNTILDSFILQNFDFFYENMKNKQYEMIGTTNQKTVKDSYVIEYPCKSKNYIVNKEKIIAELFNELKELAEMLKIYLSCFINSMTNEMNIKNEALDAFEITDRVFSFNYTNIVEKFYGIKDIKHLHGEITNDIILGVNSDEYDELENMNADFIVFKKYYQRQINHTEFDFDEDICPMSIFRPNKDPINLKVIGHSLDVSDKDILQSLFDNAQNITIFHHNQQAEQDQIKKLIMIYGKEGFYKLKSDKKIEFVELKMIDDN